MFLFFVVFCCFAFVLFFLSTTLLQFYAVFLNESIPLWWYIPLNFKAVLNNALDNIVPEFSSNNLAAGLQTSIDLLTSSSRSQASKYIIFLLDSRATDAIQAVVSKLLPLAERSKKCLKMKGKVGAVNLAG